VSKFSEKLTHDVVTANERGYKFVSPTVVRFAVGFVMKKYTAEQMLLDFIDGSVHLWPQIAVRNEEFFISHAPQLFGSLPENHVTAFRLLFSTEDAISKEDRDMLYDYFDNFVHLAFDYIENAPKGKISPEVMDRYRQPEIRPAIRTIVRRLMEQ